MVVMDGTCMCRKKLFFFSKGLIQGDASLGAARAGNPAQAFLRLKAKEGPKSGSPFVYPYTYIYMYVSTTLNASRLQF